MSEKEKDKEQLTYEDILKEAGEMGKFQIMVFILLCFPFCLMALTVSSYVFTHGIPEYRCHVPGCEVENTTTFNPPWLNTTIPAEGNPGSTRLSRCQLYNYTKEDPLQCFVDPPTNETIDCNQYVYDTSTFGTTIVTEFELTCEKEWLQPIVGAIFMIGMLIGSLIFGPLSDRFGRRVAFITSVIWMSFFAIVTTFSPDIIVFSVLRFLTGLGSVGCFQSAFVWGIEYVGVKYFIICGFVFQSAGTITSMGFTGIAYAFRDWKILQLVSGIPSLIFISYWWIIPESPRWLLSKGKRKEAKDIIIKMARFNKREISETMLDSFFDDISPAKEKAMTIQEEDKSKAKPKESKNILHIFKSSVLRKRALIMFAAWTAADMGYYGLSMTSAYLYGDFYTNFLLSLAVELPSYFFGVFFMNKLGRRLTLVIFLIICGLSCLVAGFVPSEYAEVATAFSLIGKFSTTLVLANVYSYTTELFPTVYRSAAVGMCSTCGRIGAILAPIVASTARIVFLALPFLIFGIVNLVVGILTLLLPETLGVDLPSTIEEAVQLEKHTVSCNPCTKRKDDRE